MTPKEVQQRLEAHSIRHIKVGGFDVDGILRGKYLSTEKFVSALFSGIGFCDVIFGWDSSDALYDTPSVTGWARGYPDAHATIDADSFRVIPWEPDTALFLLDFQDESGAPHPASPRQVLQRVLAAYEASALRPVCAFEFEFFVYREDTRSAHEKRFQGLTPHDPGMFGYSCLRTSQAQSWGHELLEACQSFGIPIEGFHTETGPGVFEAAIRYSDALSAADRAALFKGAVKEICSRHGLLASFMAKPDTALPGCSGHIHQSVWRLNEDENLFQASGPDPDGLSPTLQHFLGGLVADLPAITAFLAPNENSYKRLLGGDWAPRNASWGMENRTCALRVIPGAKASTRIENRVSGADVNPYLALAASLSAGLNGIRNEAPLPPPTTENAYESNAAALPETLHAATEQLDRSESVRSALGQAFVDHYLVTRRWETKLARRAVTDWERVRYLESA